MGKSPPDGTQYFIGTGGDQTGPFSEEVILESIRNQTINIEALIWAEGFDDWKPILAIPKFKNAFHAAEQTSTGEASVKSTQEAKKSAPKPESPQVTPDEKTPSTPEGSGVSPSYSTGQDFEPVFTKEDLKQSIGKGFSLGSFENVNSKKILGITAAFLAVLITTLYVLFPDEDRTPKATFVRKFPKPKKGSNARREIMFRHAKAKMVQDTKAGLDALMNIVKKNSDDKFGKQAANTLVGYYKRQGDDHQIGEIFMIQKEYRSAHERFLRGKRPNFKRAVAALGELAKSKDLEDRYWARIEEINLLLGPLKKQGEAERKIKEVIKAFPKKPNPFSFYEKPTSEKMASLFERLSFRFVQIYLEQMKVEFPHLHLVGRPILSLKKVKKDNYRIESNYKGDLILNRDRLSAIHLNSWLVDDTWHIVETNLTPERAKWAKKVRAGLKDRSLNTENMYHYLSQLFLTQFPGRPLHTTVSERNVATKPQPNNTKK